MSFPLNTTKSKALNERAHKVLPGGNTRTTVYMKPHPLYAVRGEGCRVWDADGTARIDCTGNFTSMIHGYAHPKLVEAATAQLPLGSAFGMPTESEIELAELLCGRVKSMERIRFANSGTEAVMTAIKAARAFTNRPKMAKCEGAYHGSYDYVEVSLDPSPADWSRNNLSPTAYAKGIPSGVKSDVVTIPFNDATEAARLIREHGAELACVLVDPMPNRAGLVPAEKGYLEALRDAAHEVGALLIIDEVIAFRLGYHGAQGIWNVDADLTTLGKIMGGGFPVGAIGGRADVMAVFDPTKGKPALPHGGTFSANPVTMKAGLVSMQMLDKPTFARLDAIGDRVRAGINAAFAKANLPGGTAGMGSLLRVHMKEHVRDYRSAYMSAEESRRMAAFVENMLLNGVMLAPNGLMALSTPMSDADIDEIIAAAEKSIRAAA